MKHFFLLCLFPGLLTAETMHLTEQLGKTVLYGDIAISPDGKNLAWVQSTAATTTKQTCVRTASGDSAPTLVKIDNAAERRDADPAWSPDSKTVAFFSNAGEKNLEQDQLWIANADGSDPRLLFGDEKYGTSGSPAWSPDGRWIVFDTRKDGDAEIYVISAEGGAARRLTTNPADDVIPCWSHDGKWIYFGSNRTGRPEIFKMPASGGEAPVNA